MPAPKANRQLNKQAEAKAMAYFRNKGFIIKAQNYRFQRGEVDMIVQKGDLLVFVEIKARTSIKFGYPEAFVHPTQQSLYQVAANQYIQDCAWHGNIRFDIIAFHKVGNNLHLIHFEDAFY